MLNTPYTIPSTFNYRPEVLGKREVHRRRGMVAHTQAVERRLSIAENENLRLAINIRDYLKGVFPGDTLHTATGEILVKTLPQTRNEYKFYRDQLWADPDTGEIRTDLESQYMPLIKLYYSLFNNYHKDSKRTAGTLFIDDLGRVATNPKQICTSRHKLNQVYNFYKSNIIRGKFKKLLMEMDATGILRDYHPVHITLTVPRDADGNFQGERFFGDKLLYWFNLVRKYPFFKKDVFAGEVGMELKKGKNTGGYHQHLHSFTLLHKGVKINKFRKQLQKAWKDLTGGEFIWVETLYKVERHSNGRPVRVYVHKTKSATIELTPEEYKERLKADPTMKERFKPENKKVYVDPATSSIDDYIGGIMECIKYHFKPAMFLERYTGPDGKPKSRHDVEAILEVLQNTYRKRLYTRFGFFYGLKQLALNFKEEKEGSEVINVAELADEEFLTQNAPQNAGTGLDWLYDQEYEAEEAIVKAYKEEASANYAVLGSDVPTEEINPFTLAVAEEADGWPVLYNVNRRKHPKSKNYYKRFELSPHDDYDLDHYTFLKKDVPYSQIIKLMALGMATDKKLKESGFVEESMQTLKDNISLMYHATKHRFAKGQSLAEQARKMAVEKIAGYNEYQVYSAEIALSIQKVRQKLKDAAPSAIYWQSSDTVNRPRQTSNADMPQDVQMMLKQSAGADSASIKSIGSNMNMLGKLKMRCEQEVYYLRQLGYAVEIDTNGKIVKLTPPAPKAELFG